MMPASRALRSLALAAAFACLGFAGCSQPALAPRGKPPYSYRVGPDDVLSIAVFEEKSLLADVVVTPDHMITFPLVGTVSVAGLSLNQIADLLKQDLVRRGRFKDEKLVNLTVTLKESRSTQVQLWGEVGKQGPIPFTDGLSVVQAITKAGGVNWTTANLSEARVVRGPLTDPLLVQVDLEQILDADQHDFYLAPGDIVIVPARWVTRMDRYVSQLLSPVNGIVGTARTGAAVAIAGGTTPY